MIAVTLAAQISSLRRLISLKSFAGDTAEGRADERHRRLILSGLTSGLAKGISIATTLVSVSLALRYFGPERYGMWLTISSFIAMLAFADMGLGNGLLNRVAAAYGRDDDALIAKLVSSAFVALTTVCIGILCAFWATFLFVPWQSVFNVSDPVAVSEAAPSIGVFATCFALSIPAAMVQKVQIALQRGFVSSLWACAGSVLALASVIGVTQLELGLPWLVGALMGAPMLVAGINSVVFFSAQAPNFAPRWSNFSFSTALLIAQTGTLFLFLQLVAGIAYASDPLIIAHVLGPQFVPDYSVPERMFTLVGMVIGMGLSPLWPAYGEAINRGDTKWVRQTFIRSVLISCIFAAVGSITLVLAGPFLLRIWVGDAVVAAPLLLVGLGLWKVIESAGNAAAMLLNGAQVVGFQVIIAAFSCIVIFALKFILVDRLGVGGTVWGTIIGYCLCAALPIYLKISHILRTAN